MKKNRILFVSPTARVGGGGELGLTNIIKSLDRTSYDCAVAVPFDGEYTDTWRKLGCKLYELPIRPFTGASDVRSFDIGFQMRLLLSFCKVQKRLFQILIEFRPQTVYVNSFWAVFYVAWLSRLMGKRVIWHVRDLIRSTSFNRLSVTLISKSVCNIIAISRAVGEALIRIGAPTSKITVVHNGIDLERFDIQRFTEPIHIKLELGFSKENFIVLAVGRIIPRKGYDTIIKAVGLLSNKYPNIRLVIIGEPYDYGSLQYKEELIKLVNKLGIQKNVLFAGWKNNVEYFMAMADVFVSASWAEPFGRTIVEAMGMGLPVIATNKGGEPEIVVNGTTGILVSPKNERKLASALELLARDSELRRQMGKAGRQRVISYFSLARVAFDIKKILET